MAQPLTVEAWFHTWVSPCWICLFMATVQRHCLTPLITTTTTTTCFIKANSIVSAIAQLVACSPMVCMTCVQFSHTYLFISSALSIMTCQNSMEHIRLRCQEGRIPDGTCHKCSEIKNVLQHKHLTNIS
jgi:hypothetical protein